MDKQESLLETIPNPNHPQKGSTTWVAPIRSKKAIENIKKRLLATNTRDYLLFVLGINTAFRLVDLRQIKVVQVRDLKVGDSIVIKESKTKNYRRIALNPSSVDAVKLFLNSDDFRQDSEYLFAGRRGLLTVPTLSKLIKEWCTLEPILKKTGENHAGHTLRKTFVYWAYKSGVSLPMIMEVLGHGTEHQSLAYIGLLREDIQKTFIEVNL
jgi:integrase